MNSSGLTTLQSIPTLGGIAERSATSNPIGAIGEQFILAHQIATALMHATLIPDHLRGERKKIDGQWKLVPYEPEQIRANVMMVCNRALQWGVDPIALIAESFVVGGKLDFQGKVIIAVVNRLGGLRSNLSFEYEGQGEDLTVIVTGTLKNETTPRTVRLEYRKAVTKDNNGKINEQWTKDVESKLAYSGAKKWARRHTPEVILGLFSEDDEPAPAVDGTVHSQPAANYQESPALPSPQSTARSMYESRIGQTQTKADLERIVDKIKAEVPKVLSDQDKKDLIGLSKSRWRMLVDQEQDEVSQVPAGSDESIDPALDDRMLHYEAAINECTSQEELEKWIEAIDKDENLPVAKAKALGQYANERARQGFVQNA